MKKILGLAISALMVMGLVGGGTWAFFNDFEQSTDNIFTAGTLVIGLGNTTGHNTTDGTSLTFTADNWAPGDTEDGTLYVYNGGTLDTDNVTVNFNYDSIDYTGFPTKLRDRYGAPDDTGGASYNGTFWGITENVYDNMIVATTATWKGDSVAAIAGQTLAELKAAGNIALTGTLTSETEGALYILFTFDPTATNGCQGNEIDVTVTVTATQ